MTRKTAKVLLALGIAGTGLGLYMPTREVAAPPEGYPTCMPFTIRRAGREDIPAMAALAARLVREHHAVDPLRFMLPDEVERGYRYWFEREHRRASVVMRVAIGAGGALVGYTYARLEDRDWNSLLDAFGALHDLYVDENARGAGIGEALVRATLDGLRALGAPRCVLQTMWGNAVAQRLFERLGFRRTMVEMTCELMGLERREA